MSVGQFLCHLQCLDQPREIVVMSSQLEYFIAKYITNLLYNTTIPYMKFSWYITFMDFTVDTATVKIKSMKIS